MKSIHFFKGLSWLLILNIIIKPVWIFGIDRQVQNAIGYHQYGTYFSILNLSIVLSFIADAGLTNMVNRQLALSGTANNIKQLLFIKIVLLIGYACSMAIVLWAFKITRWDIVVPIVYIQIATSLFLFFRNIITAQQLFTTDAWLSIIDKFLMIVICGTFLLYPLVFGHIKLTIFLYSQMFCTTLAIAIAVSIMVTKNLLPQATTFIPLKQIAVWVSPFVLIILFMSAHNRLDAFLLERLHHNGAYEAGIYASAYRLLDAGNTAGYLAASFLVPFLARHKNNTPLIQNTVLQLRHLLMVSGIVAAMFIIVFATPIEAVLYHTHSLYAATVLQYCIAVLPAYYLVHIYSSALTAFGQFKALIRLLIISVLINTIINLLLIPNYGAVSCTMAAIISQYICAITLTIAASKRNYISLHAKSLVLYILSGTVSLFIFLWLRQFILR